MPKEESFTNAVLDKKGRVFVEMFASWCRPCAAYTPTIEKLVENGTPVHRIDVDKEPRLAAEFQVMSVPTMILFENGQPIGSYAGVKTFEFLKKMYEEN